MIVSRHDAKEKRTTPPITTRIEGIGLTRVGATRKPQAHNKPMHMPKPRRMRMAKWAQLDKKAQPSRVYLFTVQWLLRYPAAAGQRMEGRESNNNKNVQTRKKRTIAQRADHNMADNG